MTDIIERLRGYARDDHERGCNGRYYDCSCGYDKKRDPLLIEAADEIERLRAALELWHLATKINVTMEGPQYMGVSFILGRQAWERTRAALEGK
jgi:hypothetical protein